MLKYFLKFSLLLSVCVALSGCLGFGSLNHKQVRMLKKEGFVLTEDGWTLGLPERLLFDFDQTQVKDTHKQQVLRLCTQLHKYNLNRVKIIGYTDNIGNAAYNLKLSKERAQSVAAIFYAQGFTMQNVQIEGRGSAQPIYPNTTEANRAANRRVAIVVIP